MAAPDEKPRERRRLVLVKATVRIGGADEPAWVHNYSSRGMLLSCSRAPRPGSYIEVRTEQQALAARVVWTSGKRFGVRTRDPVLIEPSAPSAPRIPPLAAAARAPASTHAAAELAGRSMQWAAVATAGALLAGGVGAAAAETLRQAAAPIAAALR